MLRGRYSGLLVLVEFLLYVNDISRVLPDKKKLNLLPMTLICFGCGCKYIKPENQNSNYCIEALNQWFIVNRLHANVDKTNIMVFLKNKANDISVKLNKINITKVEHCQYLGIFLDETLNWLHRIDTVYSKLMKYVGIFIK